MWGRPASQEELDAWESLTRKKGRKGKKKWKVFGGKKEKPKVSSYLVQRCFSSNFLCRIKT